MLFRSATTSEVAEVVAASGTDLRDTEDDGTAFSAARRLGYPDLDALYEAVGLDKLSAAGFLAHLGTAVS